MSLALFAVVGPSGAGKDTLMELARDSVPGLRLARRVITRPAAAGGEDFEGVTEEDFARRDAAQDFALSWRAHGLGYGIPWSELTGGTGTLLFNASRGVLPEAQRRFPGLGVVLVTAPGPVLAARLAARGRETREDQAGRLARAAFELPKGIRARVVVNDGAPAEGLARFIAALQPARA